MQRFRKSGEDLPLAGTSSCTSDFCGREEGGLQARRVCGLHCEAEELKLADPNHWPVESGRRRPACLADVSENDVLHAYQTRN